MPRKATVAALLVIAAVMAPAASAASAGNSAQDASDTERGILGDIGAAFSSALSIFTGDLAHDRDMCTEKPDINGCPSGSSVGNSKGDFGTVSTSETAYHFMNVNFDDTPDCVDMRFEFETFNTDTGQNVASRTIDPDQWCASNHGYDYVNGWWVYYYPGLSEPGKYNTEVTAIRENTNQEGFAQWYFTMEGEGGEEGDIDATISASATDVLFQLSVMGQRLMPRVNP